MLTAPQHHVHSHTQHFELTRSCSSTTKSCHTLLYLPVLSPRLYVSQLPRGCLLTEVPRHVPTAPQQLLVCANSNNSTHVRTRTTSRSLAAVRVVRLYFSTPKHKTLYLSPNHKNKKDTPDVGSKISSKLLCENCA